MIPPWFGLVFLRRSCPGAASDALLAELFAGPYVPAAVLAANLVYARMHGYRIRYRVLGPADAWAREGRAPQWGKVKKATFVILSAFVFTNSEQIIPYVV